MNVCMYVPFLTREGPFLCILETVSLKRMLDSLEQLGDKTTIIREIFSLDFCT